jgi:hypothetical protein
MQFATDVTAKKNNIVSITYAIEHQATNQGVVGSNPAGRAIFQWCIPIT